MEIPTPAHAVAAFAAFVRERLGESLGPLLARRDGGEVVPARGRDATDPLGAARHLAMVIIGAAAPFAPTAHARARLLRQAHASGLLSEQETEQAIRAIGASG
jgi:hypothetical protein